MNKQTISVNLNDTVRVKLTSAGQDEIRRRRQAFADSYPHVKWSVEPRLDDEGFYCTSMWSLMEELGHMMHMAVELPFETKFEIVIPVPPQVRKETGRLFREEQD